MLQIAVKADARSEAEADYRDYGDEAEQPSASVRLGGVDLFEEAEGLLIAAVLFGIKELRQEDQGAECRAKQHEGGEETEIAEQFALSEKQACKGSYRGYAAQAHGFGLCPEHLLGIRDILELGQHVQHIADGNAQDNHGESHSHKGDASLDPIDGGHREEGAVNYGKEYVQEIGLVAETEEQEREYDQQGYAYGQHKVLLDCTGVVGGIHRGPVIEYAQLGIFLLEGLGLAANHLDETGPGHRIERLEVLGDICHAHFPVRREKMPVHNAIWRIPGERSLQSLHHWIAQSGRVVADSGGLRSVPVIGHKFHIFGHARVEGIPFEKGVEAVVGGGIDISGEAGKGVVHRIRQPLVLYAVKDIGDKRGAAVLFHKCGYEFVTTPGKSLGRNAVGLGDELHEHLVLDAQLAEGKTASG